MIFKFIEKRRKKTFEREEMALKEYLSFCEALNNEAGLSDDLKQCLGVMYWCKNNVEMRLLEAEKKLFRIDNELFLIEGFVIFLILFVFSWYFGVLV